MKFRRFNTLKRLFKACLSLIVINGIIFTGCLKDPQLVGNTTEETKKTQSQESKKTEDAEQAQTQIKIVHENIIGEVKELEKVTNTWNEDLNGDGVIDNIEFTVDITRASWLDVELKINDVKIDLRLEAPSTDIHIIDIDPSDQYKEIDVFEYGPVEPKSIFYIYNGEEIIEIGRIHNDYYTINEKSQIVSNQGIEFFFEPSIIRGYHILNENHNLINVAIDKKDFLNKEYRFVIPTHPERDSCGIYDTYKVDRYMDTPFAEIKAGDTVEILDTASEKSVGGRVYKIRCGEIEGWFIPYFLEVG